MEAELAILDREIAEVDEKEATQLRQIENFESYRANIEKDEQ